MNHLILGTAGHVDHGKTSLVKALTGIDCDTHPQEKARGITINLGFSHLTLPSGDSVGIVDVPGHRDFVHTMVSGASGIDIAMLVIAADESVMPQTREHLQIMEILGVKRGLIALNKVDLVEPDLLEMAIDEVRQFTAGTFLEGCPVIPVSSLTGAGLPELVRAIGEIAASTQPRAGGEVFRMYIDRIFSVVGFGTVVTGSVLGGKLRTEDRVFLLPGGTELRVRRLERHGETVPEVVAGDRASLNLVGLDRSDFRRGMLVADRVLSESGILDARLKLFDHARPFELWTHVVFLLGTYEAQARVHLLDRDGLRGGQEGLVQLHFPTPCVAQCGDRFVIRSSSSDVTLGGGEIIDPSPLHHRRRTSQLVAQLSTMAHGKLPELVALQVRKHPGPVSSGALAQTLNAPVADVEAVLTDSPPPGISVVNVDGSILAVESARLKRFRDVAVKRIGSFHRQNPLLPEGVSVEELFGILGLVKNPESETFVRWMLAGLQRTGVLKPIKHTWALTSHSSAVDPDLQRHVEFVETFLRATGIQTAVMADLTAEANQRGIDDKRLVQILRHLVRERRAYEAEGSYLHASVVDASRKKLVDELHRRSEGLTVAQFRDLVQGNRKACLLMYAIFDAEGTTERRGDVRVVGKK